MRSLDADPALKLCGPATDPVDALPPPLSSPASPFADHGETRSRRGSGRSTPHRPTDRRRRPYARGRPSALQLLVELTTICMGCAWHEQTATSRRAAESMHRAPDAISPAPRACHFNGTGQCRTTSRRSAGADSARARATGRAGGYGRLISATHRRRGSGWCRRLNFRPMPQRLPSSQPRRDLASQCGPAPVGLEASAAPFRQGIAFGAHHQRAERRASWRAGQPAVCLGPSEIAAEEADQSLMLHPFHEDRPASPSSGG